MTAIEHAVNRLPVFVFILAITALLSACSNDDDDTSIPQLDGPVDEILPGMIVGGLDGALAEDTISTWFAFIIVFQNTSAPQASNISIDLLRDDPGRVLSDLIEIYTPDLDTCRINDLGSTNDGDEDGGDDRLTSGGTSVTINSSSGPWLVAEQIEGTDSGLYEALIGENGSLPTDATLSIPGDSFPNVPDYDLLSQPPVPTRLTPAAGILTEADVLAPFTWTAMPDLLGGFIELDFRAYNTEGDFEGFAIDCRVSDDGEFSLPQNVIDFILSSELMFDPRLERAVSRLDVINGVTFYQKIIVAE